MLRNYAKSLFVVLGLGLASLASTTTVAAQNSSFPQDAGTPSPSSYNAASQYLVYVPNTDPATVQQVKAIAPEAFRSQLSSGEMVMQIGRFNNMNLAQHRVEELKSAGIIAQVTQVSTKLATAPSSFPTATHPTATPPITQAPLPSNPNTGIPSPSDNVSALPGVPSTPNQGQTIDISRPGQTVSPDTSTAVNPPPTLSRNRYFVIVPSSVESVLQKVRTIAPNARLTASERGTYIEAQGFPDRGSAEALNTTMRSQGLDSRVIYF
ncbi:hypothetical protein [Pseudanabaena sp. PCC 6802]|uniref:hypothetical protein n=1 Tax=Pseudanabaena sp. PCC 6802 TaxID=118173 RepID=UPI00034D87D5|nr:hypothetical protein [Pseudanabaena sp. PCC 6802]